eukprot:9350060-Heterocapsa_arctica.AAC.1
MSCLHNGEGREKFVTGVEQEVKQKECELKAATDQGTDEHWEVVCAAVVKVGRSMFVLEKQ